MSNNIFDPTIGALNTSLNIRLMNQNVISSNIANADTPNFKAKRLDFEQELRTALQADGDDVALAGGEAGHIAPSKTDPVNVELYVDPNGVESLDGNTVQRDKEMAEMVQNQIMYNSSLELLNKKLGMLKYAINEGGGNR